MQNPGVGYCDVDSAMLSSKSGPCSLICTHCDKLANIDANKLYNISNPNSLAIQVYVFKKMLKGANLFSCEKIQHIKTHALIILKKR
jgi:hypothetical protein